MLNSAIKPHSISSTVFCKNIFNVFTALLFIDKFPIIRKFNHLFNGFYDKILKNYPILILVIKILVIICFSGYLILA